MKIKFLLLLFIPAFIHAESMYSPSWGFFIDLPAGYEYVDGDSRNRFSFSGPMGLMFDLVVYSGVYRTIDELVNDANRKLSNQGDITFFDYNNKQAALIRLNFGDSVGWGICVELDPSVAPGKLSALLALAYGPGGNDDLELFHLSSLDSIAPTRADRLYPGPIMEFTNPRGEARDIPLAIKGLSAMIYENDAEAAQILIEREYLIYSAYLNTPYLMDAAIRYYRFIYRDSYDRVLDAVSAIARYYDGYTALTDEQKRDFARKALAFVQGFSYERDLDLNKSDFVNLVSAVTEGRGDCDSRATLFAMIIANANIRSAIMLSPYYSHAMGLADIAGYGARFESHGIPFLVAETTAKIDIGLIDQEISDISRWFAVIFE